MSKPKIDPDFRFGKLCSPAYKAGLIAGEKRLARALRRYLKTEYPSLMFSAIKNDIFDWLTTRTRAKRGKK